VREGFAKETQHNYSKTLRFTLRPLRLCGY
jgi:hypothetical protein